MDNLQNVALTVWGWLDDLAIEPMGQFLGGLAPDERLILHALLVAAGILGFILGRRRPRRMRGRRSRPIQNQGEELVTRTLTANFGAPDYHLMNHVTIQMCDGTTQVDHILVSRFGVFVIETKHYKGWVFGSASGRKWTQVLFSAKYTFQNPLRQNHRHVRAVQGLLDFLEPHAIRSVVVFTGEAEFRTEMPEGVLKLDQLVDHIREHADEVMSVNGLQFCVGRLETGRLAITAETDVEHVRSLNQRHGVAY